MDVDRDPGYLRFRRNSVRLGCASSLIGVAMVGAYVAATWHDGPHRGALAALSASVVLVVAVIQLTRAERLVETRWCDPFFAVWSAAYVIIISVLALLDGGSTSPLVITFFAPLVFAGTCYP